MGTFIVAKKNLVHADGQQAFTKGKEYYTNRDITHVDYLMSAHVTNDQNEDHIIGTWNKHFKIVKHGDRRNSQA
jgi:hypothetical protein